MADSSATVGELFKAKAVTKEQVSALVDAVVAGELNERAELAEGYVLDLAAAVKASAFATSVLADETSKPGARRNAARTAILLARAEKA
ncbi:hypothetical protein [Methylorubrum populi]|uniref:Uncharacterized protein n=1 Tax=Methylorubrum populi TaxID=223967 RepID=A0A833J0F2_9HYPH|nr:hypothetical protein [Methylorubrum populi]KAB7782198.1 hypothetical protein F8B43_4953 [Methylorubrum populi]